MQSRIRQQRQKTYDEQRNDETDFLVQSTPSWK